MHVGDKLRTLRKNNNLTLKELHSKTGLSISFISDIENKRRNPSIDTLKTIAKALGVSVNDFFDNVDTKIYTNDELSEKSNIEKDFPLIPPHFTNPDEARSYVMKHQIFAFGGFYPEKMSDEDILNFANEMINQAELISYKYRNKTK